MYIYMFMHGRNMAPSNKKQYYTPAPAPPNPAIRPRWRAVACSGCHWAACGRSASGGERRIGGRAEPGWEFTGNTHIVFLNRVWGSMLLLFLLKKQNRSKGATFVWLTLELHQGKAIMLHSWI